MSSFSASSSSSPKPLATELANLLLQGKNVNSPATPEQTALKLLQEIEAWAVGIWQVNEHSLTQLAFAADPDFPAQVATEFQQATVDVPLDQTQLGIVNAVVNRRSALAVATELQGDLRKSAGWLQRFQASCSLSCPVNNLAGVPLGVLAVAWKDLLTQQAPQAQKLSHLTQLTSSELSRLSQQPD